MIKIKTNISDIVKSIDKLIDEKALEMGKKIKRKKEAEDRKRRRYKPNKYKLEITRTGDKK